MRAVNRCGIAIVWSVAAALAGCGDMRSRPASRAIAPATSPRLIAHRGGTGDAPENTLEAIRRAIANHADALWLTVQLSRDGIPVLYRPADLSALTDATGPVASYTAAQLARVNAGYRFVRDGGTPYRDRPIGIPTLAEALAAIPPAMPVILDMKALPADAQTQAVARVLDAARAWPRVSLYSTEDAYQRAFAAYPQARVFEARDATRARLARVLLADQCAEPPAARAAVAFEMHRELTVSERFTLGTGESKVNATMWTPRTVACFRTHPDVEIVAIAVNDADDYRRAACLGMDAVLVDSPEKMAKVRAAGGIACLSGASRDASAVEAPR